VFALNFVCVGLAYGMWGCWNMALISSPIVRIKACHAKWHASGFQLHQDRILMATQDIGSYRTPLMGYGMPQPALLTCMRHLAPQLIHFCGLHVLDGHLEWCWL